MNTSPDHPDFTALALGEHIHGTPAQVVIEAMRTSVAARTEAEQIRQTGRALSFVLKGQPPLRLDAARRDAIFNADPEAVRARFAAEEVAETADEPAAPAVRKPATWRYPLTAVAAVVLAAVGILKLIPGYTPPSQRPMPVAVETEPEPTGKVMVTLPPTGAPARERVSVNPPAPPVVVREMKLPPPDKAPALPAPPPPPAVARDKTPPVLPKIPVPAPPPETTPHAPLPAPHDYATPVAPKRNR